MIGDGRAGGAGPVYTNGVPLYDGAWVRPMAFPNCSMSRYVQNRHNSAILMGFADMSVRRVGLKELWDLRWHRGHYYIDAYKGPSVADHVAKDDFDDLDSELGWGHIDHWMYNMKEFSPWLPPSDPRR